MKLLALLLLLGCAHGPLRPVVRATDRNARLVRGVVWIGGPEQWQHMPWYRAEYDSIDWPHRVVVSIDGSGCLMPEAEVNEPQQGDFYACLSQWRLPR